MMRIPFIILKKLNKKNAMNLNNKSYKNFILNMKFKKKIYINTY